MSIRGECVMNDFLVKALVWPLVLLVCFFLLLIWLFGWLCHCAARVLHLVGELLEVVVEDDLA